jgi:hypothetical protein
MVDLTQTFCVLFARSGAYWALAHSSPGVDVARVQQPAIRRRFGQVQPSTLCRAFGHLSVLQVMVKSISFEPYFQMQSVIYEN